MYTQNFQIDCIITAVMCAGVGAATAGTLTFIVGGPQSGFDRAKPLLELMGKNVVHCGQNGAGQVSGYSSFQACLHYTVMMYTVSTLDTGQGNLYCSQ